MPTEVAVHIARNLKQLRESRSLTQEQMARASGVPRPTWASLESGAGNPTIAVLVKVAAGLQVTVEELISPPRAIGRLYHASELVTRRRGEGTARKLLPHTSQPPELDPMELSPGSP